MAHDESLRDPPPKKLFIIPADIDTDRAHYHRKAGNLEAIARGVYVRADLTPEDRAEVILAGACRIARAIYPHAALFGASAYHLGPVDGVLSLCNETRCNPKDIGGVLKVHVTAFEMPAGMQHERIPLTTDGGEMLMSVVPDEVLIVSYFEPKNAKRPPASVLSTRDLMAVVDRCVARYGSHESLGLRLERAATGLGCKTQAAQAKEFIAGMYRYQAVKRPTHDFKVFWHEQNVARLTFDGAAWSFQYEPEFDLSLTLHRDTKRKRAVPSFIAALLAEDNRSADMPMEGKLKEFSAAERYISNIVVRPSSQSAKHVIVDVLDGRVDDFCARGDRRFTGAIGTDITQVMADEKGDLLTELLRDPKSPRVSGMQVKFAAHLSHEGVLSFAHDKPFTHIVKPPHGGKWSSMGSLEFYSMALAEECGIDVEKFCIADIGAPGPTFVAERFDIRQDLNDRRRILGEELWAALGLKMVNDKYDQSLEDVAHLVRTHSTDPDADGRSLLRQVAYSWVIGNQDLHLKNLMFLKEADPKGQWNSVQLSPAYDVLHTRVYEGAVGAALKIGGDNAYHLRHFVDLGATLGISRDEAKGIVADVLQRLEAHEQAVYDQLPRLILSHEQSVEHLARMRELMRYRRNALEGELTALNTYDPEIKKAGRPRKGVPA